MNKKIDKFYLSRSVAPNSPGLIPFAYDVCDVM